MRKMIASAALATVLTFSGAAAASANTATAHKGAQTPTTVEKTVTKTKKDNSGKIGLLGLLGLLGLSGLAGLKRKDDHVNRTVAARRDDDVNRGVRTTDPGSSQTR